MPILSKVGSFNTGTAAAGNTVVISDVGFEPKVLLFWWSGRTESIDTIGRATHLRGFGVAVSATGRWAVTNNSVDAVSDGDTQRYAHDAACIILVSATPALNGALDLQSLDSGGYTLVVDTQMGVNIRVHYLALGGDSITDVATGAFAEPAATGDQDITGLSFQPEFVLFGGDSATTPPTGNSHSTMTIGAAVSSSQQGVWTAIGENAAATTDAVSYCTDNECIAFPLTNATGVAARADFVQFLTDGFRITWLERNALRNIFFLAMAGGDYRVENLLTQTDTTTDIAETGFGFSPSAGLFVSHGQVESTLDTVQAHDRLSIGAFSSLTERGAQGVLDEDNVADTEVTTAIEFDAVYVNISTGSAVDGLMDVKSLDSDGFTCIMDDADPAQAFVLYAAFGPAEAGGGILRQIMAHHGD